MTRAPLIGMEQSVFDQGWATSEATQSDKLV